MADGRERPKSSEDQRLVLEEYKETLAFMRHTDNQAWTILGLSGTVALGLWAFTFKETPIWSIRAVILALFGVAAIVVGRLMARRLTVHADSRMKRAIELEGKLGFQLVSRFSARCPNRRFAPSINPTLDAITWLVIGGWLVYVVLAFSNR